MKELSIEEKAKAYDEAIEGIQEILSSGQDSIKMSRLRLRLQGIFPELAKSDDERIRKALINYHKSTIDIDGIKGEDIIAWLEKQSQVKESSIPQHENKTCEEDERIRKEIKQLIQCMHDADPRKERWLAWLEKQGSPVLSNSSNNVKNVKCSADRIEPKFKVGDWITFYGGEPFKILKIEAEDNGILDYLLLNQNGHDSFYNKEYVDENARLWTIADAKDGDVLYSLDSNQPFIYKERPQFGQAIGYCCINKFGEFAIWNTSKCIICTDKYIPATEEQRDTLMKAMADAGYTFDFEKKELKKIEHDVQLTEFEEAVKDLMNDYRDAIGDNDATIEEVKEHAAYMLSLIHQNFAWSEEDNARLQRIIDFLWKNRKGDTDTIYQQEQDVAWLKTLKQRLGGKE